MEYKTTSIKKKNLNSGTSKKEIHHSENSYIKLRSGFSKRQPNLKWDKKLSCEIEQDLTTMLLNNSKKMTEITVARTYLKILQTNE